MNNARRIMKNSFFQAVAFVAQGLTEFLVALLLARLAGAQQVGEFTILVTLAGLFAFISAFGFPSLLTREIARQRDDREQTARLVNAATGLVIILSTAAILLMTLVGILSGYSTNLFRALMLTGAALAFESVARVVTAPFRGVEDLKRSSAVTAVMELSFLILAVVVALLEVRIDWLMAAYLTSRIIALGVAIRFYRSRFGRLRPTADWKLWRTLLHMGLPFSINNVFSSAYSRVDVIILSFLAGHVAVGFYEVAYSLTMRMNIVARTLTFALYPFLSFQFVKDVRSMRTYTARGIRYLIIPGFLIATLLWVFGREFTSLLYGEEFAEATSSALKLLALIIPLRFVETLLGVTLDASNRAGKRATAVAIAAVTNAALNFILVPAYQMMGAVYATVITEVVICGVFIWYLRDQAREIIEWRAFVGPGLGALIIISISALFSQISTWWLITPSILLYGLAIVVLDRSSIEPLLLIVTRKRP